MPGRTKDDLLAYAEKRDLTEQIRERQRTRIAKLHADGLTDGQISRSTGWSFGLVRNVRIKLGLPPLGPRSV